VHQVSDSWIAVALEFLKRAVRFALADGGSVTARVLRSGIWVGLSNIGMNVLNVVRSVVLARLLTPDIFGLMGLAMVVLRATDTFTRPGVSQALIARQQDFDTASSTAFTMLVIRGFLLALVLAAIAPWVADFYDSPQLTTILQVLSLVFVLNAFANINTVARQKELDFRRLTYLAQVTNLCGTVITIAVAFWLRSIWALVVGQLVQAALNALWSYYFVAGRMRFSFDRGIARELFGYGKFITGSSAVTYVATELDSMVIGKVSGMEALGFYTLAMTISALVTHNLARTAAGIMMPAYSKLQNDRPALRNAYLRVLSMTVYLIMPTTIGLIVAADSLLYLVYGPKWMGAVLPLQVLSVFGIFRALLAFNGYLFEGIGKPKVAFTLAAWRLALLAPLMVPMVKAYGIVGAAVAVTLGALVHWGGGFVYLRRHVDVGVRDILQVVWRPVVTALVMGFAVWGVRSVVDPVTWWGLGCMTATGAAVFVLLNLRPLLELKNRRL
jgi:O-antigen/teichoic acid export membrane protein